MDSLVQDVRYGLQLLARRKLFSAVALLTLALCIGANTAIFSVINAVLLRPLPFPDSRRLVILYNIYPNVGVLKGSNGVPDYFDRREEAEVFDSLTLLQLQYYTVGTERAPLRVSGMRATPSVFPVFRTVPALGRPFTDAEAEVGSDQVVILGHELWRNVFGGTPAIVGQEIRLDGIPRQVVGVMPPGFELLSRKLDIIVPFAFTEEQKSDQARHSNFATMIARLREGVDIQHARTRIDALNARNSERFPQFRELLENAGFATRVVGLHDEIVESIRPTLYLLQVGVAFVLLIGCVNIANLILMHSNSRTQELAIRSAIGAGRGRIARQLLTESVLLAGLGGLLGLLVAAGALRLLTRIGLDRLPGASAIGIDATAAGFTCAIAVVTGLVFGTIPAMQVSKRNLEEILRLTGRSGSPGRPAALTRSVLVVAQVSLAFILLVGAGLMVASLQRLLAVDPGFRPAQILTTGVSLPESRYEGEEQFRTFAERALERLSAIPSVRGVAMITMLPFSGDNNASVITIEGQVLAPGENPPVPHHNFVDDHYLAVMGIPLRDGRFFEPTDTADALQMAVIDQHLAERYWPNESPVGKRLRRGIENVEAMGMQEPPPWLTIVGVVGNVKTIDLATVDDVGTVYVSQRQFPRRASWIVVKGDLPEAQLTSAVRREILALDPELPLYFDTKMLEARLDESLLSRRAPMTLLLVFAGIALFLSAVGIYGVLAYSVSQRTREIGIRMALGAEPSAVLAHTLWSGGKMVLAGLVGGAVGALWLGRLVSSLLYGVTPLDPGVFGVVLGVLTAVALLACAIPSHRATQVNAVTALRHD